MDGIAHQSWRTASGLPLSGDFAMPTTLACPDVARLQQFLLGWIGGSEAVQLEQHVAACPRCLEELRHLATDDPLERALQERDDSTPLPLDDLAAAAIAKLKRL